MTQSDSSPSARTCARVSRRRSLSEGCNLHLLAAITEGEPVATEQPESDENEHQLKQCVHQVQPVLAQRSKSESVICTAQGVRFEDKYHTYQTRLDNLVAIAANPCSSSCNALLAKKALRYRYKTMERRRACS
ncbi:hypothetical protein PHYPSEUDO_010528 [Phytophthora pseudosyringae]|uniref:Uncharacterized protein n=1 Tax=Phytophthora pseudosyringae TaxID=221518 RepID=A0A8T1VD15_9STRA|nr:hypothetical protein PHYPSEUDO_010528 [Phytophthora pseudosyringae]